MAEKMGISKFLSGLSSAVIDRVDWWITVILKTALAIGVVLEVIEGNWLNALATFGVVVAAFVPFLLGHRFQVRIPPEFEVLAVVFVYASLFLGNLQGFYNRFWWWDIMLHTASGLILGIFGFLLVYVINEQEDLELHMKPSFVAMFAFMFSLSMGTLWEIFEFTLDSAFGMNTQAGGLVDTMSDLIVDGIGALVISLLGYAYLRTSETESFLERWITHYIALNRRYTEKIKKRRGGIDPPTVE